MMVALLYGVPAAAQTGADPGGTPANVGGPIRLRPVSPPANRIDQMPAPSRAGVATVRSPPGEFELFVQRLATGANRDGADAAAIRRFGVDLVVPADGGADSEFGETSPLVPPDYVVKPGDEIVVTIWGSVDADLRTTVDRNGRITIPRVGPILVAGIKFSDLPNTISQRVSQVFRNFQVSVSLGQLRAIRIYVTGFVAKPGAHTVSSLSSVVQALLQAGGPSAAGSFRSIELRRARQRMTEIDLYDFLLKGDLSGDHALQADDVVHVNAVGTQVGLIGSVNRPAVFELKSGETVADVLRMAGGFTAVADRDRVGLERVNDRSGIRIAELALPASLTDGLTSGDVLRAFSAVGVALPVQLQNKRVRIEGELAKPGEYVLKSDSTLVDAIQVAGGLTPKSYLFGTEFSRESVRLAQQQNYERALRDLETDLVRSVSGQRASTGEEAIALSARSDANSRLLARMRATQPSGRIVLELMVNSRELPPLTLEDGDRIFVPPIPSSVGVFGSVFNAGNYLYQDGRLVDDYLRLAGGSTRGADSQNAFVIRANGSVVGGRQRAGWFGNGNGLSGVKSEPGDTVFVPEEINKSTFMQNAKDWTQILYQFGIGLAAIKTFRN